MQTETEAIIRHVLSFSTSTTRLLALLQLVDEWPASLRDRPEIRVALASQWGLAAFHDDLMQINASSLNTLKLRAKSELEAGWLALDNARRKALNTLTFKSGLAGEEEKPRRGSRAELDATIRELKRTKEQLQTDNWQLIKAVHRLLANADSYVTQFEHPGLARQVNSERREILAMFSLLNQPLVREREDND